MLKLSILLSGSSADIVLLSTLLTMQNSNTKRHQLLYAHLKGKVKDITMNVHKKFTPGKTFTHALHRVVTSFTLQKEH